MTYSKLAEKAEYGCNNKFISYQAWTKTTSSSGGTRNITMKTSVALRWKNTVGQNQELQSIITLK